VRIIIARFVLLGAVAISDPALANEVSLHKHSADELKNICQKTGGKFSQDASGYGCGTNCHGGPGTDCIVACKADQNCTGQVIGSRRPKDLQSALQAPAGTPR
jgi:hypothetical protein